MAHSRWPQLNQTVRDPRSRKILTKEQKARLEQIKLQIEGVTGRRPPDDRREDQHEPPNNSRQVAAGRRSR